MIHVTSITSVAGNEDARQQVAQLRHVLSLIEEIAGTPSSSADAMDEMARIARAYDDASPIAQRRFDAFAAETADWASVGVNALIGTGQPARSPAAARRLADELTRAIGKLDRMVS